MENGTLAKSGHVWGGRTANFLGLICKISLPIQRYVPAIGTPELGTVRSESRLLRQKIIRHFPELNSRMYERKVAIWAT
jgi:hypothetical protein